MMRILQLALARTCNSQALPWLPWRVLYSTPGYCAVTVPMGTVRGTVQYHRGLCSTRKLIELRVDCVQYGTACGTVQYLLELCSTRCWLNCNGTACSVVLHAVLCSTKLDCTVPVTCGTVLVLQAVRYCMWYCAVPTRYCAVPEPGTVRVLCWYCG